MTGPSSRVPLLLVLVWLGGLLAATSVGLLAVRLVAAQVGDPAVAPLSAVAAASAAAAPSTSPPATSAAVRGSTPAQPTPVTSTPGTPAPATPAPVTVPPTPRPTAAAAATRTFTTAAGRLGVQCAGTSLRLLYATPAQGYALDERSVSGEQAEVRFEGGGSRVRVRLSCATGAPQLVEQRTDPGGGGGDDREEDRQEDPERDRGEDRDDD